MSVRSKAGSQDVRLGCTRPDDPHALPLLTTVSQSMPLPQVIAMFCEHFKIKDSSQYALRIDPGEITVTEENRKGLLKDGVVLQLALTPSVQAERYKENIAATEEQVRRKTLMALGQETLNHDMAAHFVACGGVNVLLEYVTKDHGARRDDESLLGSAFRSIYNILEHGLLPPSMLEGNPQFTDKVIAISNTEAERVTLTVLRQAMGMAAQLVRFNKDGQKLAKAINLEKLFKDINEGETLRVTGALNLLNEIIRATPAGAERQALMKKINAQVILENLGRTETHATSAGGPEQEQLKRQLHVFQRLLLQSLHRRSSTSYSAAPEKEKLEELIEVACIEPDGPKLSRAQAVSQRLGLMDSQHPEADFEASPGLLLLDGLTKICNEDTFADFEKAAKDEGYGCSFLRMARATLLLLMDVLGVGKEPEEGSTEFHRVVFSDKKNLVFFELYGLLFALASRTLRQMEAKPVDFEKVVSLVEKRLRSTMDTRPKDQLEFKKELMDLNYSDMLDRERQMTKNALDEQLQTEPVQRMKAKLRPEMEKIVVKSFLKQMQEGAFFQTWSKGRLKKDAYLFLKLSHKTLHWCERPGKDVNNTPTMADMTEKCDLETLACILVGKDNESIKKMKKADDAVASRTFGLMGGGIADTLEVTAETSEDASLWMDGIRHLMDKGVEEEFSKAKIDELVDIEIRLRIINLQGVQVPAKSPVVPAPPDDFDFQHRPLEEATEA